MNGYHPLLNWITDSGKSDWYANKKLLLQEIVIIVIISRNERQFKAIPISRIRSYPYFLMLLFLDRRCYSPSCTSRIRGMYSFSNCVPGPLQSRFKLRTSMFFRLCAPSWSLYLWASKGKGFAIVMIAAASITAAFRVWYEYRWLWFILKSKPRAR